MPQSTPSHGGAQNATNELLGISFALVLKPNQNQIFENQDRHPKAARSAALTRGWREAPPRPTARKALRAGVRRAAEQESIETRNDIVRSEKAVQGSTATSAQRVPNFIRFWYISHDLGHLSLKACSGVEFLPRNDPPETQNPPNMYIPALRNVRRVSE